MGYSALKSFKLPFKSKKVILALGSQTKNTLCLIKGGTAYLTPEHRTLSDPGDFLRFRQNALRLLRRRPQVIAFDAHPEYQSSKFALETAQRAGLKAVKVQHHHAHIASCMVDNGLKNKKVIGVAFDGTGLGDDGNIWGAEFIICNYKSFRRAAHLKEIRLLGGERAIMEPWRLAAQWLGNADFAPRRYRNKWGILKKVRKAGINIPLASSMGRLFDAAGCLILEKYEAAFEGELAVSLNNLAGSCSGKVDAGYPFVVKKKNGDHLLDPGGVLKMIILDLKAGKPKELVAYRFHLTVAHMIRTICIALRKENNINTVVLSGGVFQNNLLLKKSLALLYKERFAVLSHKNISCNDSGISLGEAAIASHRS
jgi:hydrogenase maturation protein HypF